MADVNLTLGVDTDEAEKELKKFARDGAASLEEIQGSFKALGAVAAGALAFFAGRELVQGVNAVIDAAKIQENAVNQLNTSLKLAGDFTKEASQDIQDYASALQAVTTVGDETTLELFSLAKAFNLNNEETKNLTTAAVELAAATGQDVNSALKNLGKTTGGLVGELGEVLPSLKNLSKEALESGAAIQFVLDRFGGSAAAQVNTFEGALTQLSNVFGDFQEEIGFIITKNPQLIASFKEISRIIGQLSGEVKDSRQVLSESFGDIIEVIASLAVKTAVAFQTIGSILNDSKLGYRSLAESIVRSLNLPSKAYNSFEAFVAETYASIIGDTGSFVSDLISALKLIPNAEDFFPEIDSVSNSVREFTEGVANDLESIAKAARNTKGPFADLEKQATRATAQQILANQSFIASTDKVIESLSIAEMNIKAAGNAAVDFGEETTKAAKKAGDAIEVVSAEAKKAAEQQAKNVKTIADFFSEVERKAKPVEDQLRELGIAFSDAYAVDDAEKVKSTFTEIQRLQKQITDEVNKTADARAKELDAQEKLIAAQGKQIANAIGGAVLGADVTATVEIDSLSKEIFDLKQQLGAAALSEQDRLKLIDTVVTKEKALADAEKKRNDSARGVITSTVGSIAEVLLPGFGGLIGSLTDVLSQGPEASRALIEGIVDGIPVIIEGIADSIPVIIEVLIDRAPEIITALAEASPKIISALVAAAPEIVTKLVQESPRIAEAIIKGLIKQAIPLDIDFTDFGNKFVNAITLGAGSFAQKLIDEIKGSFGFGGGNDRVSGGNVSTDSIVKNATDTLIAGPIGAAADLFSGLGLTSTTGFAQNQGQFDVLRSFQNQINERDESLVSSFAEAISNEIDRAVDRSTRPVVVNLEVGQAQLASVLLNLNRNGFRVA